MNWIKNIFNSVLPQAIGEGTRELQKKEQKKIVDEDLSYMAEKAREKGALLSGMIKEGGAEMLRRQLKEQARQKVSRYMTPAFSDSEIIEEVTDRLVDAAMADPHYKAWFS
ncbi:MAG: hypothetical protein Q7S00_06445 [bacterium]|nr:hypothetical protein [bacterium]